MAKQLVTSVLESPVALTYGYDRTIWERLQSNTRPPTAHQSSVPVKIAIKYSNTQTVKQPWKGWASIDVYGSKLIFNKCPVFQKRGEKKNLFEIKPPLVEKPSQGRMKGRYITFIYVSLPYPRR